MNANRQLVQEKLNQATQILNEVDIDCWIIFVRETSMQPDPILEFIFGGDMTWHSAFILNKSGEHIALVGHYDAPNVVELDVYSEVIGYHEGISSHLIELLNRLDPQTIGLNYSEGDVSADGLSHGLFLTLKRYLADTPYVDRFVSAEKAAAALRGRKSPTEIARVKAAVATTEKVFDQIETFVKPGMTQKEIATYVHSLVDGMGHDYSWPKAHNPIVTCGPHSAVGHASPGDVPLEPGHLLHIDLGIRQNDYSSDLQRMWYVLKEGETEAPAEVQHAFMTVAGAIQTGKTYLVPGKTGWEVDEVAREFVVDNGYPEYMHAFGHLVGRVAHDGGIVLGPRWERYAGICDLPVEVGNIFALELHVIVKDRGMMSLEENALVTEDGVEFLSTPQEKIRLIKSNPEKSRIHRMDE
ncbi:MAG: M24 family metallopeptidase [Anaerolineae bacterium]